MLPRLKTAEQFAAVLNASKLKTAQPSGVWRSSHFALHMSPLNAFGAASSAALKIVEKKTAAEPFDSKTSRDIFAAPHRRNGTMIGIICPKRWAKRAVTRNTIKRQIYAVTNELRAHLPVACIVLRLASGFSREQFVSATSSAFKHAVREELLGLLNKLLRIDAQAASLGAAT